MRPRIASDEFHVTHSRNRSGRGNGAKRKIIFFLPYGCAWLDLLARPMVNVVNKLDPLAGQVVLQ